jgi:hypothetical protein
LLLWSLFLVRSIGLVDLRFIEIQKQKQKQKQKQTVLLESPSLMASPLLAATLLLPLMLVTLLIGNQWQYSMIKSLQSLSWADGFMNWVRVTNIWNPFPHLATIY